MLNKSNTKLTDLRRPSILICPQRYKLEVVVEPKWLNFMRGSLLYTEIMSMRSFVRRESFERKNIVFIFVADEFEVNALLMISREISISAICKLILWFHVYG